MVLGPPVPKAHQQGKPARPWWGILRLIPECGNGREALARSCPPARLSHERSRRRRYQKRPGPQRPWVYSPLRRRAIWRAEGERNKPHLQRRTTQSDGFRAVGWKGESLGKALPLEACFQLVEPVEHDPELREEEWNLPFGDRHEHPLAVGRDVIAFAVRGAEAEDLARP